MPSPLLRRRQLLLRASAALAGVTGAAASRLQAAEAPGAGARLCADFEPQASVWLGYDAGHETFTGDLAAALQPYVPLRLLVRDAEGEAAARRVLAARGLAADAVPVLHDPKAILFVRDAAVFARAGAGRLGLVDFRWTHYGWGGWCRQRHGPDQAAARACSGDSAEADDADGLDRRLAAARDAAVFFSPLAMEGGGVESNGQGLLIANEALWTSRNPRTPRAELERELLRLPGVRKLIWLPAGLAQDPLHRASIVGRHVGWGTGGHTDEFVRFADPRTVLLAWPDEEEAARHPVARLNLQRMQANLQRLQQAGDEQGRPLRILKLPLPRVIERRVFLSAAADLRLAAEWSADTFLPREGRRQGDWVLQVASASTLNFVVANGTVLVPDYRRHGTPARQHEQACAVLEAAFPGRRLQFIDTLAANWLGGGAHCATLSEPALS